MDIITAEEIIKSPFNPVYVVFPENMKNYRDGWYVSFDLNGSIFVTNGLNSLSVTGIADLGVAFYKTAVEE